MWFRFSKPAVRWPSCCAPLACFPARRDSLLGLTPQIRGVVRPPAADGTLPITRIGSHEPPNLGCRILRRLQEWGECAVRRPQLAALEVVSVSSAARAAWVWKRLGERSR